MRRILLSLCVFLLLPVSALLAESAVETLERGETSLAAEVVDGDTLLLKSGTKVRLVGIQAPKLPLGRAGFEAWPLAEEAQQALEDLALGQTLTLYYGGRKTDRYGRALAHLKREDRLWLQGALLVAGMARVYSFRDNLRLTAEMQAEERDARAARRGIWAHPYYTVRTPEAVADDVGSFQLVEGRVMDPPSFGDAAMSISVPIGKATSPFPSHPATASCSVPRARIFSRSRAGLSVCAAGLNPSMGP